MFLRRRRRRRSWPPSAIATRERWQALATSTATTDHAAAERALTPIYSFFALPAPRVEWCRSPLALFYKAAALERPFTHPEAPLQVADDARSPFDEIMRAAFDVARRLLVKDGLVSPRQALPGLPAWTTWLEVQAATARELPKETRACLEDVFWIELRNTDVWWTQHLLPEWLRTVMLLELATTPYDTELPEPIAGYVQLTAHSLVFALSPQRALLCERPTRFLVDEKGQLHAASGPAARWPDGFEIYALHGESVPAPFRRRSHDAK